MTAQPKVQEKLHTHCRRQHPVAVSFCLGGVITSCTEVYGTVILPAFSKARNGRGMPRVLIVCACVQASKFWWAGNRPA